ncbi:hypothetical protein [Massilia sp. TN1-12]|uniref:hypothetical protein n=1 Tax=Massilia paldalensis TaxID=3377675 RepID=UPI00384C90A1
MSITKYKTTENSSSIQEVDVIRETASFVYLPRFGGGERREAKQSSWDYYHDSWEEAHAYLMKLAESHVKAARRELELANGRLGNIKGMKPPEDAK